MKIVPIWKKNVFGSLILIMISNRSEWNI